MEVVPEETKRKTPEVKESIHGEHWSHALWRVPVSVVRHSFKSFWPTSLNSPSRRRVDQVTEQVIGTEVFKRKPGYSTGDDNIVRTYARQMRKRLDEYFSTVGAAETLIISIPKGGYAVEFHAESLRSISFQRPPISDRCIPVRRSGTSSARRNIARWERIELR